MNGLRLLLKCRSYGRQGLSKVTRLAATGVAWLVRLARPEPRNIPASLESCAEELRQIVSDARGRAEATVLRTAEKLDARFGASSQGAVKGAHSMHEEVLVWQRKRVSETVNLRYKRKGPLR